MIAPQPEIDENYTLVSRSISNSGDGLFLFVKGDLNGEAHGRIESGGSFPQPKMPSKKSFKIVVLNQYKKEVIELGELDFAFPVFDIFSDGRVVIAASRCRWRGKDDYDLNGLIYNPATGERIRFLAGDGIQSLSVDNQSRIYISYFDEGVFGNFGWGNPGPIGSGAGGVNCFNDCGERIWYFNSVDGSGEFISDCYAMNVNQNNAYVYYYTDFSLCRIGSEFERKYWKTGLSGCHHFAISDEAILFSGEYDEGPSKFHLAKKFEYKLSKFTDVKAKLELGKLTREGQTIARGANVHYFNQDGWFRASIHDLLD